ncbi:MAG: hypothetical protein Q4C47_09080, partial [Planctomycetia bacterium]|nr:hypothetical protein [Planctomycetia bacterium]
MFQWTRWMCVCGTAILAMSLASGTARSQDETKDDDPVTEILDESENTSAEEMSPEVAAQIVRELVPESSPAFRAEDFELKVGDDATADELMEEFERLASVSPPPRGLQNVEMFREYQKLLLGALCEVADRLLSADPNEEQAENAVNILFAIRSMYSSPLLGSASDDLSAFDEKYLTPLPERLEKLGYENLVRECERQRIFGKLRDLAVPEVTVPEA